MSPTLLNKPISEYDKAYNKAIKFLDLRLHTSFELKRKLQQRGFKEEAIDKAIEDLKGVGFLNDLQFAEVFLDNLIRFKSFGYYGLKAKLLQRGIDGNMVEKLLKEKLTLEGEKKIALRFVEKARERDRIKIAQSLSRKGFRSEVINDLVKNLN
jgi:regulatory protein